MIQKNFSGLLQGGESVVKIIEKHWIVYVFSGLIFFGCLIVAGAFIGLSGSIEPILGDGLMWGLFSLFLLVFLSFIILNILSDILDTLIVTDKRIISIRRDPPFGREIQSVAISDMTEIHAESKGILPTIFGYGKIQVGYMGGSQKVHFDFAPNPSDGVNLIHGLKSKKVL